MQCPPACSATTRWFVVAVVVASLASQHQPQVIGFVLTFQQSHTSHGEVFQRKRSSVSFVFESRLEQVKQRISLGRRLAPDHKPRRSLLLTVVMTSFRSKVGEDGGNVEIQVDKLDSGEILSLFLILSNHILYFISFITLQLN